MEEMGSLGREEKRKPGNELAIAHCQARERKCNEERMFFMV